MNKTLFNAILFTTGAAIGSLVTWKVVKTKYERISQEEIDSVKEEYGRLRDMMKKEIDACRKVINSNQNESNDDEDADPDEEQNDDEYPDDGDRDFTEHEKEMIDYYKISSKYRGPDNNSNKDNENIEKGEKGIEEEAPYINGPYVITPEEFGSEPGYNAQSLDYFADGVLADSWGVELDIDETIGDDTIDHFGEYVDDVVYVRNERTGLEYEVTRDPRTYEEAVRTNPDPYYGHAN